MNKQQIAEKLLENHKNFVEFIANLNEQDFMFSDGEKWSAGQQLDHLVRGVSPVKLAFTLPKLVPSLMFGKANRSSKSYDELVVKYQAKLASGGRASGRFIPAQINFSQREVLQNKLLNLADDLSQKVEIFSEEDLDKYVIPHPLIGKLTFREMLYFTIYHCEHHHKNAIKLLENK
jgi:hypothetical protein